jgi:dimethylamine/trimethylamine dehydrogenase
MNGVYPDGEVILYDDDHYYMGAVLAELMVVMGKKTTLVTPAPLVSSWSHYTLEQERTQKRLVRLGVRILTQHKLEAIVSGEATILNTVLGTGVELPGDSIVLVTDQIPNVALYYDLKPALVDGRLASLRLIGDAEAPHIIAQAVYSGHLAAREFDEAPKDGVPFRREATAL